MPDLLFTLNTSQSESEVSSAANFSEEHVGSGADEGHALMVAVSGVNEFSGQELEKILLLELVHSCK
jgi:hypothetical protein